MGSAATRQVPALPRPVPLPAPTDPRSSRASRPERRAARGPSTGSARQHCLFSMKKSLQRATDRHGRPAAPAAGKPCPCTRKALCALSRGDMSTPQKRLPTGHYLQTTSDNRRSGRRPGSAVAAQMPRRMRQSARLRPSRCPSGGADARFRRSFDLRNARRVTMRRPGWHATASRPWTSGLSMVVLPAAPGKGDLHAGQCQRHGRAKRAHRTS